MSLLMDALRKAEEAKKKAAQEAESKQASAPQEAADQPAPDVVDAASTDSSADVELSMADMEDVPKRSAVPNLDTPIEFEDEEDYVLPSSVGTPAASDPLDSRSEDGKPDDEKSDEEEPEAKKAEALSSFDLATDDETEEVTEPPSFHASSIVEETGEEEPSARVREASGSTTRLNTMGLDAFAEENGKENAESSADSDENETSPAESLSRETKQASPREDFAEAEQVEPLEKVEEKVEKAKPEDEQEGLPSTAEESMPGDAQTSPAEASPAPPAARPRIIVERESRTHARRERVRKARERKQELAGEAPKRRTARNVFAAKKSSPAALRNLRIAAGGGVLLLLIFLGAYIYLSMGQQSTFNVPVSNYVPTEYIEGVTDALAEAELASEDGVESEPAVVEEVEVPVQPTGLATLDVANDSSSDTSVLEALLSESEFPEVAELPEPEPEPEPEESVAGLLETVQSAANLEPETLEEPSQAPETVASTIGDAQSVAIAPNVEEPNSAEPNVEQSLATASEAPLPAVSTEPENLISFRRQQRAPAIDPNLDRAFSAYQRGALTEAEAFYRQALQTNPLQRDALLGLATISERNGNSAEALDLYSRLLSRNPRDPIARAGLIELLPATSPVNREADLQRLLSEYPNVAALEYAHGNFLASNQRWSEAQLAYFRALQLAKTDAAATGLVNPDYAFNLAVSLEHLNQRVPAQNYYREALEFAANHPAGFDVAAVRTRLADLAGSTSDE